MSTPAPPRDRPSWANVVRRFPRPRPQWADSGVSSGSGSGGRVHVGERGSAERVRWGWREKCLRIFRDSFGGKGECRPLEAADREDVRVFGAAHAAQA